MTFTVSLNVTWILIDSPDIYVPAFVVELTPVTVGTVVSITIALEAARFVPIPNFDIALPAASLNEPALNAIEAAVRSEEVSPAPTVYKPEAVEDAVGVVPIKA